MKILGWNVRQINCTVGEFPKGRCWRADLWTSKGASSATFEWQHQAEFWLDVYSEKSGLVVEFPELRRG